MNQNQNMPRLRAIVSPLLMSIKWNSSSRSMLHSLFPSYSLQSHMRTGSYKVTYFTSQKASPYFLIFIHIFQGSFFSPFLKRNIRFRVPSRIIRHLTLFSVASKSCPYTRYGTAANFVCSDTETFSKHISETGFTLQACFIRVTVLIIQLICVSI